ncbi:unnamed protein product [Pleuronectes platessa]|uniref:Uncharacterized protein n=1 Tax=Pleuronectes platessa TaxID=8262 RepID=A0A9N7YJP7_PLEPL|nr:unnamed protein product [Pleuronectes platessa]
MALIWRLKRLSVDLSVFDHKALWRVLQSFRVLAWWLESCGPQNVGLVAGQTDGCQRASVKAGTHLVPSGLGRRLLAKVDPLRREGVQRIWLADRQADANSESNSGTLRDTKEQQHKGAMGKRTEARGNARELNRRPDMEDWEHGDRVHRGGRDNWTLVKDIRAGQTITKAGKLDKHRN